MLHTFVSHASEQAKRQAELIRGERQAQANAAEWRRRANLSTTPYDVASRQLAQAELELRPYRR